MTGNRNLLFGMLALQMDFIDRESLLAAMQAWVFDKEKPLSEILREQGKLTSSRSSLLEQLVEEHLQQHQGDAQKSLAAVPASSDLKEMLRSLREPELEPALASLGARSNDTDSDATTGYVDPARNGMLRYQILRPHAKGGLGEVFVALDGELNREVALKEIQPEHADVAPSRSHFLREAEITGGLEHPGIVPVYGLGTYPDGRPYYVMRFIRGDNLKEAVQRFHRGLPIADCGLKTSEHANPQSAIHNPQLRDLLRRFIDVCNAIAYAHSRGVLHRDLKPGNVMLGQFGETLVVDWGLAKVLSDQSRVMSADMRLLRSLLMPEASSLTLDGSALGTPPYMSPEQAAGKLDQLGPATDIYSLGATLFTILTNRPPIESNDVGEILRKVQAGDVGFKFTPENAESRRENKDSPSSLRPSASSAAPIPPSLKAICQKAMSLNPADRYPSALDVALDVENYLADEPVSAYPEPLRLRLRRFARRHRTLVTSAAAVLVMATIGLVVGLFLLNAKNTQLETAYTAEQAARALAQEKEHLALDRKKQADENFVLALEAVKAQVFDIDKELENRAATRDLREKLSKSATERLKKLVEKAGSTAAAEQTAFGAHVNLGDVYMDVDRNPSLARAEYERAYTIAKNLVAADPRDAQAQHALLVSFNNLGDVCRQTGDTAAAVKFYTDSLDISTKLAAADPRDARAQRDLSVAFNNLGDVSLQTGDADAAAKYYTDSLGIRKKLAAADPRDALAQRALAISFSKLGAVSRQTGDSTAAAKYYTDSLDIRKKLAAADPRDARAQRDLSVAFNNLGDVSPQTGDSTEAAKYYADSLGIRKKLAAADPRDALAQRDLAVSLAKLADVSLETGDVTAAAEYYSDFHDIFKKLAAADPRDAQAQRDLAVSLNYLGSFSRQTGNATAAAKYYTDYHEICKKLAAADTRDAQAQTDLFISYWNLGRVEQEAGRYGKAIVWYRQGLEVLRPLHAAGKLHAHFKDDVGKMEKEIAACELLAKWSPGLIEDPAWSVLWGWPRH